MPRVDRRIRLPLGRLLAVTGALAGAIAWPAPAAEKRPNSALRQSTVGQSATSPAAVDDRAAGDRALTMLSKVGANGADNEKAAQALHELVAAGPDELPRLLAALDHATPLGANWIRAAIDTIANRRLAAGGALPSDAFEAFFADRSHAPRARRLAYEWLVRIDPTAAERLAPSMLDDPSVELRREAVARALAHAAELSRKKEADATLAAYRQAFDAARDDDQIKAASDAIKELGQPVDLAAHYGFIRDWRFIGPFDNADKRGYDTVSPPEKRVDLAAEHEGKLGPVRWKHTTTDAPMGEVDLNQLVAKEKGVLAYVVAELDSPREQPAEVRVGCENAIKIWLNGELVFEREVYHAFVRMDQYVAPIRLRAGRNTLLMKICQNEQTDAWAGDWKFQARISDATGGAIILQQPAASSGERPALKEDK